MIAPARTAAFQALRAINAATSDLPAAISRSRASLADERDRSLLVEIVTGTVRWQRNLDHLIERMAHRAPAKLDPELLVILRLSLYQLLHLDRVPAAAVVDDAVDLARAARKPSAAGFVNAVLRSTLRSRRRLPFPARPADGDDRDAALAYLGITHSHPGWLVRRLLDRHGFDNAERWVQFDNDPPLLTLRVNRLLTSVSDLQASLAVEGIETERTPHAPHGLVVTSGNPMRLAHGGSFVVQDEASQLVTQAVAARAGETVLDLCASPGGKTAAMAADMQGRGIVVACDVRPRRMRLLQETVRATHATSVRLVHVPTESGLPFTASFDRVLVDAPCSGLGTIRRDPDIRWRRAESDLAALAERQLALLARAAAVVKRGGRLVYATCSSEPEENEAVVDAFLGAHREFALVDLRSDGGGLEPFIDDRGMLRTLPFAHGLEAFFAAAMVRGAGSAS